MSKARESSISRRVQDDIRGLLALRDWLKAHRVTQVAMEATGVYWKPVWHVLEPIFEADFDPCSYGFRPKRRAMDAIAKIHYLGTDLMMDVERLLGLHA